MGNTWIVDMGCYLDSEGRIGDLPSRVRRLAEHFGAIVIAVSPTAKEKRVSTGVACRRRPRRRPCPGQILALIGSDEGRIHWICPACSDGGAISGWEGSPWDARREGPLH